MFLLRIFYYGGRYLEDCVARMSHGVHRPLRGVRPGVGTLHCGPRPQTRSRTSGQERVTDGAGGVPVTHLVSPATGSPDSRAQPLAPQGAQTVVKSVPRALSSEGHVADTALGAGGLGAPQTAVALPRAAGTLRAHCGWHSLIKGTASLLSHKVA